MLYLILAVLAVFVVQTLLAPLIQYTQDSSALMANLTIALRSRDNPPDMPILGQRAARALANMKEALPVFLTLALLHVAYDSDQSLANIGATVFLGARILYAPAYLSNIIGVRSVVWAASWVGLGLMIGALFLQNY